MHLVKYMKRVLILLLLLLTIAIAYSQDERYYYYFTEAQIKENIELNRLKSSQVLHFENSDFFLGTAIDFQGIIPTTLDCISIGKFKLINDIIYCFDKRLNRIYKFKQIDFYTLEAMNHTAVFVKGTKLYLHMGSISGKGYRSFYDASDLIKSDYWKTGIKNGIHIFYDDNKSEKLLYYRNNILKDSIALFYRDSAFNEKRTNFLKRYYVNYVNAEDSSE
jgi:hypothetical protein